MFELVEKQNVTVIKVVGVGGAGGNAVAHMVRRNVQGVDFICANTDVQVLSLTGAGTTIQLGESGLGAGANPDIGRDAALTQRARIADELQGANMVFVTAGMGGGTGTGAAPVVAEIAKEMGILTVGVVSKPFEFEGPTRMRLAEAGIAELSRYVDSLIVVLNESLEQVLGEDITQKEAFRAADDVLYNAVAGIAEIINSPGMINVDFQDVRTVMASRGRAMMGSAVTSGEDRAREAAEQAIACPLLDGANLSGAQGLLVNITASEDTLKLREPREVMQIIRAYADEGATVIYGAVYDNSMGDDIRVTVVATGLGAVEDAPTTTSSTSNLHLVKEIPENPVSGMGYADLEMPAVVRRRDRIAVNAAREPSLDCYDIPAFLRKQVD